MHVRVTKGRGSKKAVVYFVAYACALNRTLIFRICKAESRKCAISKLRARYEGAAYRL